MSRYSANITAGSLLLPQSRRIAELLLQDLSPDAWEQALRGDNMLQARTPTTALRQARLIRARLETLPRAAWQIVAMGDKEAASQTLLAGAVLHSALLGDFMREVLAVRRRRLDLALTPLDWEPFLADCAARDPAVATWTPSTRAKLLQVLLRMLAEARYLESTRSLKLRAPDLHPDVRALLKHMDRQDLIDTLELRA